MTLFFRYVIAAALNYQKSKNNIERISKIKHFINKYNWKEINFPSHKEDWNNFEKDNKSIALNVLYVPYNTQQIANAYLSKHNSDRENQVILLMIRDGNKLHYLAGKNLSALLRGIISKHHAEFYCLNCLYSFTTEYVLKEHENVCKDHGYCHVKMPDKDNNILNYNPGKKCMKVPFVICHLR